MQISSATTPQLGGNFALEIGNSEIQDNAARKQLIRNEKGLKRCEENPAFLAGRNLKEKSH